MAREIQARMPALIIRRDEPLQQGDVLDELVARYYVRDASIGTLELWLRK
jgi:phage tail protein X